MCYIKEEKEKSILSCFNFLKCLSYHCNVREKIKFFYLQLVHAHLIIVKCFALLFSIFFKEFLEAQICNFCCDITILPLNKRRFDLCAYVHSWSVIINIQIEFMHCVARIIVLRFSCRLFNFLDILENHRIKFLRVGAQNFL